MVLERILARTGKRGREPILVCQRILHITVHIIACPSAPAAKEVRASAAVAKRRDKRAAAQKGSGNSASETPENQVVQSAEAGARKEILLGIPINLMKHIDT